jgi:hypothetical protein
MAKLRNREIPTNFSSYCLTILFARPNNGAEDGRCLVILVDRLRIESGRCRIASTMVAGHNR